MWEEIGQELKSDQKTVMKDGKCKHTGISCREGSAGHRGSQQQQDKQERTHNKRKELEGLHREARGASQNEGIASTSPSSRENFKGFILHQGRGMWRGKT